MNPIVPILTALATLVLANTAQADEKTFELPEIKSVTSRGAFNIVVQVGEKQSVVVKGTALQLGRLTAEWKSGTLVLHQTDHFNNSNGNSFKKGESVDVLISVAQLQSFQMEGAGKTVLHNISGDKFELNYQGAGTLEADGRVKALVLSANGVGAINAQALTAQTVEAAVNGVGSVKVRATESLAAQVNGIGSLTYFGRPAQVSKSVSGIGRVSAGD